jgi:uroporphyrinogen decarboxylase
MKGIEAKRCLDDPDLHAEVIRFNLSRFKPDVALPLLDLTVEAQAFGVQPLYREFDAPSLRSRIPLGDPRLEEDHAHRAPERAQSMAKAAKRIAEQTKDVPCGFYITGPFTVAGQVIGVEELLKGTAKGLPALSSLLAECTEVVMDYARRLEESGVDFLVMADPTSSLISGKHFLTHSKEHIKAVRRSVSIDIVLHMCGKSGHLIKDMVETGVAGISLDQNVNLSDAVKAVPRSVMVFGNYPPTNLTFEKPEQIRRNVEAMLAPVEGAGNVVASTGCDLPPFTPAENIDAFIQAAKSRRTT